MDYTGSEQQVYTVTEITRTIKSVIEGTDVLNRIWIKGDIYNLTLHSSGHIYFSLKDDNAVISATFFRSHNARLTFKLEEGMSVLAFGSVTVFEKSGRYQLNVYQVRPEGIGELQKRIEQLKKKLAQEGVFDPTRKRQIPFLPLRVGIVTSPTGAALRDIIKVARRRYPNIEIVIAPVLVQGDGAVESIVRGIRELNDPRLGIDVIIAGRGGGSFEDLLPFSEEAVVRAYYESRVPIISAVGHQIDHPLCDDAADMAAPTPSAAAELAVPLRQELADEINYMRLRMDNAMGSFLREQQMRVDAAAERPVFVDPLEIVRQRSDIVEDLVSTMATVMYRQISVYRQRLLSVPSIRLLTKALFSRYSHRFGLAVNALEKMSPLAVIGRGYAIAMNDRQEAIRSVSDAAIGERISLLLRDGRLGCAVETKERGEHFGEKKGAQTEKRKERRP